MAQRSRHPCLYRKWWDAQRAPAADRALRVDVLSRTRNVAPAQRAPSECCVPKLSRINACIPMPCLVVLRRSVVLHRSAGRAGLEGWGTAGAPGLNVSPGALCEIVQRDLPLRSQAASTVIAASRWGPR